MDKSQDNFSNEIYLFTRLTKSSSQYQPFSFAEGKVQIKAKLNYVARLVFQINYESDAYGVVK